MIGKKIHNYEIKSLLGEGGMGNVYLAVHTQLGRKVAIKSLHQQLVKNEGLRARFKQEANTMAHLQHNGIVTLFDYVEDERGLFLIMEFVEGTQLDEYIRNVSGPIPAERALPILNDILDAFAYAHEQGVVHRDIKPSNILITNDGKVKILDFGIAKMLSDSGNKLTKTGTQMGTVFYMSPEQVQGKEVDIRSDIYSLGITFYQMLTGVSPYDGMTTEYEIYNKIVLEPLPFANATYPGVPAALDLIIAKATAKKKEDRFQTCREFLSFLKNPSEQIPNSISQTTIVENKQLNETVQVENKNPQVSQPSKSTSPLKVVLITLGTLFASLIILIFIFSNSENDSKNASYAADSIAAADSTAAASSGFPVITIGNQVWTTKNLDVSTYRNGDEIPEVQDASAWANLTTGAWCYYDNDASNGTKYGKLYNWYAVNDTRGLAPAGFHIPTDAEWTQLSDYLGGESEAGTKMKSTNGWEEDGNGNNESGFAGFPGGFRYYNGTFYVIGSYGYWWSATENSSDYAWSRRLNYNDGNVDRSNDNKRNAFSVRCLGD